MSIQTEIERIEQAKEALISVIKAKGIEVPNSTKISELAALVDGIENSFWTEEDVFNFMENRETITNIKLPEGLTTIPYGCFYQATEWSITELPETIVTINPQAFMECANVKLTRLPSGLKTLGTSAFRRTGIVITELPETLEYIGDTVFLNSYINISVIPASVYYLGKQCFQGCTEITEITFEGTPTTIGTGIFNSCSNLTVINVPWAETDDINVNAPWGATNATINYSYTGE